MKIIDEENDYFLHDFDNDPPKVSPEESAQEPEQAATQAGTTDNPAGGEGGNTFEFAGGGEENPPLPEEPKKKHHAFRRFLLWFFAIVVLVLGGAFYVRYFVPYITESKTTGYITNVEKRGIVFKTYEGEMVSESQLTDTSKVYQRDIFFSIPDDSLGRVVQSWQNTGKPVVITTKQYYGTLPWRGASTTVLTDISPKGK